MTYEHAKIKALEHARRYGIKYFVNVHGKGSQWETHDYASYRGLHCIGIAHPDGRFEVLNYDSPRLPIRNMESARHEDDTDNWW